MYDMKTDKASEGGKRVMGSSTSGKGPTTGHMDTKMNHPGDKNASYRYGAAGKIGLYLKTKGSAGSAY